MSKNERLRARRKSALGMALMAAAFSVQPVFPPQQAEGNHAYYELHTEPGEAIALQALITNDEAHAIEVELDTHTAYTNSTGSIVYTGGGEGMHLSPPAAFADIASASAQSVSVPAHATVPVSFQIAVPATPFHGMILGALTFGEPHPPAGAPGIKSVLQYVIAVVLTQGEGAGPPRLAAGPARVHQSPDGPMLSVSLANESAAIVRPVSIQVRVSDGDGTQVLHRTFTDWALAPSGLATLEIPLRGELSAGHDYGLSIEASVAGEEGERSFLFQQTLHGDSR